MTRAELADACGRMEKSGERTISIVMPYRSSLVPVLCGAVGTVVACCEADGRKLSVASFKVHELLSGIRANKPAAA